MTAESDKLSSNSIITLITTIKELTDQIRPGLIIPKGEPTVSFSAKVQEQGRVAIPEVERERHGIAKGDTVQIVLWKVPAKASKKDVSG